MDNDDRQLGRILTRREVLALMGAAGVSLLAGCVPGGSNTEQPTSSAQQPTTSVAQVAPSATTGTSAPTAASSAATATRANTATTAATATNAAVATSAPSAAVSTVALPACVVRPEVTEGPYYVDENLVRSDIRSDPSTGKVKDGAVLQLTFNVLQVGSGGCTPLPGATVDIWHCDAAGVYSDVSDPSGNTRGQKFLRGSQVTDASGKVTFTTIYPGWYPGRAVHIHFKIHPNKSAVFTSQLFFEDAFTDQVFTQAPYASRGKRNTLNRNDGIYRQELLVAVAKANQGYAATFDIGLKV